MGISTLSSRVDTPWRRRGFVLDAGVALNEHANSITRGQDYAHPQRHLSTFARILQADAYDGYGKLYDAGRALAPRPRRRVGAIRAQKAALEPVFNVLSDDQQKAANGTLAHLMEVGMSMGGMQHDGGGTGRAQEPATHYPTR
jgi:hypothetical protein